MADDQEASSSDSHHSYDVFLSFRGKDTRNSFTDHLYAALVRAGNRTFRDEEEIRIGEFINSELGSAIQHSRCSIIVFSENYASSSWCLDELVTILARKHESESKHYVLPVYYHVDPTDIRRQSGAVGVAFAKHLERIRGEKDEGRVKEQTEKIKGWREALTEAASMSGMVLQEQSDRKESKFIEKIVKVIGEQMSRMILDVGQYLVGIHERAREIIKWLEDGSTDVIGICGMGGAGKTTIAKYVYNKKSEGFDSHSFLADIRERSKPLNGLVSLQNQLLSEILKTKTKKVNGIDEGITKIKNAISGKRILLVLDDVDQDYQLNAILRLGNWLFYGSKIIITTRDHHLLKKYGVQKLHMVEKLNEDESIELFSLHAFGRKCPAEEFVNHAIEVVRRCGGLPLALKLLGSSFYGRMADVWVSALEKLKAIPEAQGDILKILEVSYDSLDDHDKRLFLDIAHFFVQEDKDCVVKILDECEFHTTVGIQNLVDRCLVTIEIYENKLMMHQLVQGMGKAIVWRESPTNPGKRSRLSEHKESFDVLKKRTGTESIEGLALNMQMFEEDKQVETEPGAIHRKRPYCEDFSSHQDYPQKRRRLSLISWLSAKMSSSDSKFPDVKIDAFEKMKNLRLLQLNYAKLTGSYGTFPQELRWLCWHGFPLKDIPRNLSLNSVVSLDMQHSSLQQVWQGIRFLGSLKILNLSYSKVLVHTPNFTGIPKLERLLLRGCISLSEVCESIGVLKGLIILDLEDSKNLRKLPTSICKLSGLQTLNLSGCPDVIGSLGVLLADGIPISSLGATFAGVVSWIAFPWSWLSKRRNFADTCTISLPSHLRQLSLSGCNLFDESFPQDFSKLSLLRDLDLSNNPLRNLPECIRTLGITILRIGSCEQLQSLHGLPETLQHLNIDNNSSLEIVTTDGDYVPSTFNCLDCPKLVQLYWYFRLEDITKVDRQIIDSLGFQDVELLGNIRLNFYELPGISVLNIYEDISVPAEKRPIQGLLEFCIFSTFVPGFAVPIWYTERKIVGPSVSFMVPPNVNIQCLNVCCSYRIGEDFEKIFWHPNPTLIKINNKTKDLTWIYCPSVSCYLSDDDDSMAWLSQWTLWDDEFCGGDQVTVTFAMANSLEVTECGYNFVFNEETEEEEETDTEEETDIERWGDIGAMSKFQLSTGAYFLGRESFISLEHKEEDWTTRKWFRDIFGDSVSKEGNPNCRFSIFSI